MKDSNPPPPEQEIPGSESKFSGNPEHKSDRSRGAGRGNMTATPGDGELLTKKSLSLADAKKIAAGAAAEARKNEWNLDIAVVDEGGHLIYFERSDGTLLASADLAIGKARTAVAFQRPTKALEDAPPRADYPNPAASHEEFLQAGCAANKGPILKTIPSFSRQVVPSPGRGIMTRQEIQWMVRP
jgi:hypothetical protein